MGGAPAKTASSMPPWCWAPRRRAGRAGRRRGRRGARCDWRPATRAGRAAARAGSPRPRHRRRPARAPEAALVCGPSASGTSAPASSAETRYTRSRRAAAGVHARPADSDTHGEEGEAKAPAPVAAEGGGEGVSQGVQQHRSAACRPRASALEDGRRSVDRACALLSVTPSHREAAAGARTKAASCKVAPASSWERLVPCPNVAALHLEGSA